MNWLKKLAAFLKGGKEAESGRTTGRTPENAPAGKAAEILPDTPAAGMAEKSGKAAPGTPEAAGPAGTPAAGKDFPATAADGKEAARLLLDGIELQEQGDFEGAFGKYEQAAGLGDTDAMLAIAGLYMACDFRRTDASNLGSVLMSGGPVFPWSLQTKKQPDAKSAFGWIMKAADGGNPAACELGGLFLCEGTGCAKNVERGLEYLDRALAQGQASAQRGIWLYRPTETGMDDAAYEECLKAFVRAADAGEDEACELYAKLKGGTEKQLARLGYTLMAARMLGKDGYQPFRHSVKETGKNQQPIPYLPVFLRRMNWRTLIRFNLDAFPDRNPLIAVSADILDPDHPTLFDRDCFHRARFAGTAVYRSPEFGWLKEEKKAVLIRLGDGPVLNPGEIAEVQSSFYLPHEKPALDDASAAFIAEHGEKEYSAEIACIRERKADVLFRYTIGGSDRVYGYFEPELISLSLTED